jgi:hypothetical protein
MVATGLGWEEIPVNERRLDPNELALSEDWEGNNAALTCPHCLKVFIVSGIVHGGIRKCPACGKSTGRCDSKGKNSGGRASLEW